MNPPASMRIGMICPLWLPRYGGAEQYIYRVAQTLIAQGFEVRVFTGTGVAADVRDNGAIAATRHAPGGDLVNSSWGATSPGQTSEALTALFKHYGFMAAALEWATLNELDVAMIGHPFQQAELHHVRELYTGLKARGIQVGCLHFDLARQVADALVAAYTRGSGDWEDAAGAVSGNLQALLRENEARQAYYMMGSPLFFSPEFVISCSDWSGRFIDPDDRIPKLTLHPLQDASYWSEASPEPALERCDILMVNPQVRKGAQHMEDLIAGSAPGWTFRILRGGWGNSMQRFLPRIQQLPAAVEGRIEVRHYVRDMRQAYRSAGLVFFPSLLEGYGMTAVEPMYAGVPVVGSNYPAVLEAVGEGALTCCPYRGAARDWHEAVAQVLGNARHWREKSLARATQLQERQAREVAGLVSFMTGLRGKR